MSSAEPTIPTDEDMLQLGRAIESMGSLVNQLMTQFPRIRNEDNTLGSIHPDLIHTAARLAVFEAGNRMEYAVSVLQRELDIGKAKVLKWCAAEAAHKAGLPT